MSRAAFLGLGGMGAPMALNIDRAGLLAAVWNRSPDRAAGLAVSAGTLKAASPAEAAAAAGCVITCVSRDADLMEVVEAALPGLRAGSVVVDCSTVDARTARELAARLEAHGCAFLDCPVSGGVEGARKGTLAMMVGGEAAALEQVRPVLETMAAKIVHMGGSGAGQATKAVNQIMCAGIAQAVTEALAFGEAMGLDMGRVIDVVSTGAAGNWFLDQRGRSMVEGRFDPGFRLALHHKDLGICRTMAGQATGAPLPTVEMTLAHYQELMQAGFGDEDISALFRLKRRNHGGTL